MRIFFGQRGFRGPCLGPLSGKKTHQLKYFIIKNFYVFSGSSPIRKQFKTNKRR